VIGRAPHYVDLRLASTLPIRETVDSRKRTRNVVVVGLAVLLGLLVLSPCATALSRPSDLAGAALHPWRLETRIWAPLPPLRDSTLRTKTFYTLEQAGIRRARVDLKWSSVETHGPIVYGGPPFHDWSEFDATVAVARAHHVQLEPIVSFTPAWANGGAGPFAYPTDPNTFREFMTEAMKRYPDIPAWEIWNEPNTAQFSPPRPNPSKFVAMVRAASRARTAAGSHAKIITGGLAPGRDGEFTAFAEQIAELGVFRYADALGVHPYSAQRADESGSSFLALPKVHERISRLAGRSVDIWVTEYGYPNFPRTSIYGPPADEHGQANRLQTAYALAVGWPWLKRLTWYGFRDDCTDAGHPDCRFGLLRENFSAKRAWHGYLQVLTGRLPLLETKVTIHRKSKVVGRGKRRRRVHTLSGRLFMPGTEPPRGDVLVTATRRYKGRQKRRRILAEVRDARYLVSLGRLRPGRWRFVAEFDGTARYTRSTSRTLTARVRKPRKRR
jgi:hypothetical protein